MSDIIKKKIIFIEDNVDDYEALTRSLKSYLIKWDIQWISSSKEAMSYFQNIRESFSNTTLLPNLIILDLNMPGMDGRKLLQYIKSDDLLKVIPTVILSTSIDRKDIEDCYIQGANSYIHKTLPFNKLQEGCISMIEYWERVSFSIN